MSSPIRLFRRRQICESPVHLSSSTFLRKENKWERELLLDVPSPEKHTNPALKSSFLTPSSLYLLSLLHSTTLFIYWVELYYSESQANNAKYIPLDRPHTGMFDDKQMLLWQLVAWHTHQISLLKKLFTHSHQIINTDCWNMSLKQNKQRHSRDQSLGFPLQHLWFTAKQVRASW